MDKNFEQYLNETRSEFIKEVSKLKWDTSFRIKCENLLIAFDQMKDSLYPPVAISSSFSQLKLGDEIELQVDENTIEKVTVVEISPHAEVKGSVYYTFSNGFVCRDIRLH